MGTKVTAEERRMIDEHIRTKGVNRLGYLVEIKEGQEHRNPVWGPSRTKGGVGQRLAKARARAKQIREAKST